MHAEPVLMDQPKRTVPLILICSGDLDVHITLRSRFSTLEVATAAVTTGAALHRFVKKVTPTVILLGLRLPDGDGRDVLLRIKRDIATTEIRVVIIAGELDQLARRNCLELGAADVETNRLDEYFARRIVRLATNQRGDREAREAGRVTREPAPTARSTDASRR